MEAPKPNEGVAEGVAEEDAEPLEKPDAMAGVAPKELELPNEMVGFALEEAVATLEAPNEVTGTVLESEPAPNKSVVELAAPNLKADGFMASSVLSDFGMGVEKPKDGLAGVASAPVPKLLEAPNAPKAGREAGLLDSVVAVGVSSSWVHVEWSASS